MKTYRHIVCQMLVM